MIAKIGRGSNLYGALAYNQLKVQKEEGQVLFTSRMIETAGGTYSTALLARSFEPYLLANRNTEKPVVHISLNPDPRDNVSDEGLIAIAEHYMVEMGYGQQPFAVFKHTDIERAHIHIVTVCVDEEGKKISDKFEKRRSMAVCRELERNYGLMAAVDKEGKGQEKIFNSVDYLGGDVKSQIASVVRHLPKYYQFQTLGEYNALLSLFNITVEKVESQLEGNIRQGLLYIPLNENGEKAGNPLKASLFGKNAGLPALDAHFARCKEAVKENGKKSKLKETIGIAVQSTDNEEDFKRQLIRHGINPVIRRNGAGRIYGITFIDHNSRTVCNGSRLGTEFSANAFNEHWSNKTVASSTEDAASKSKHVQHNYDDLQDEDPHELFNFLPKIREVLYEENFFSLEGFGGLIPGAHGEDYQEDNFAAEMRKKRKRRKNK
ncbi:conjugal transfer protein MobB [Flavobacterium saccharophilum]|uniref:Relaxase/Mobilisation nuclease domain-containing protein n=1 Tax=Flavobacterium saccharophilum TaxID=29534 RepID=A0A1M7FNQ2_9FLAO|nr:conjugal transfer protein MobB [Flavobacterium saccharophilum]SHM05277.1 Relaxase/Mobilisation nuclease domain-containing protein [Flavobacterium saccharophilum]